MAQVFERGSDDGTSSKPQGVILILDDEEASVLSGLSGSIHGSSADSPRKHMSEIFRVFQGTKNYGYGAPGHQRAYGLIRIACHFDNYPEED